MLICCAKSLGTGGAGGCDAGTAHPGPQEPFKTAGSPSALRETAERGILESPTANPRGQHPLRSGGPPGVPFLPCSRETPVSRKTPASVPLHSNYLTITTPYKNVELFFGIVSVLARNEEWNTSSALRTEERKGFSRKSKDSTPNRKPAPGLPARLQLRLAQKPHEKNARSAKPVRSVSERKAARGEGAPGLRGRRTGRDRGRAPWERRPHSFKSNSCGS